MSICVRSGDGEARRGHWILLNCMWFQASVSHIMGPGNQTSGCVIQTEPYLQPAEQF